MCIHEQWSLRRLTVVVDIIGPRMMITLEV